MAIARLPIGIQDFRKIIENNLKYIDKTRYIYELVSNPRGYLLSRPRRFGKSLTIATLHELYAGSRELFKGLWIEDKWDWNKKHPVIRISFTSIGYQSLGLNAALEQEFRTLAKGHGLTLKQAGIGPLFKELLSDLASQQGKVVVLIDEYDAPIINYLGKDIHLAYENREILKEFYTILKDMDAIIELVFLTGVSKFSKVGIFSGLNNLQDISVHPTYASMLGYTQEELENNFAQEIEQAATQLKLSREQLLQQMRHWYNGYRFEENAVSVYNPVSCNLFFEENKFQNFWFATGTPTFLVNLLKQQGLYDFKLTEQSQLEFDSFDLVYRPPK